MTTAETARTIGGRYRLDRPIGRGGMGTVWQGHDELLGRPVAVKEVRFPSEVGPQEAADLRERTLREARATARLSHPNVITTYDVVEEDDRPWIVMELLATRSLSEVLRDDGPLPPHRVAQIGLGLLGALETAHSQGIIHRDVKPSNVLLTDEGRAVLTDFGIASSAGDPALTSTGVVLGSPAYMSPERARGKDFGPESDLWSLGATLFAAAEGRPPFDSDNPLSTLTAVVSDPVPALSAGGPLALAVDGLLHKDPAERAGIATTRARLQQAVGQGGAAAAPAAETLALDRAGRTSALPAGGVAASRTSPAGTPDTTGGYDGQGGRRGLLVAALVVAVLLIGGITAYALSSGGDEPQASDGPTGVASSGSAPETPAATPSETATTPSSSPTPTPTETPAGPGVPEGFEIYQDDTGFSLAVPQGWSAEQVTDTAVDISDPAGGRFIRVDQTDQPKQDPVRDWEKQERSVAGELADYARIRIEPVDYRGWNAADWEFTFTSDGSPVHVLNRGFVVSDNQAYALYFSSGEAQWADSQGILQVAADTFTPASASTGGGGGDADDD